MPDIIAEAIRKLDAQGDTEGRQGGRGALSRAVRKYAAAVSDSAEQIEVAEVAANPDPGSAHQEKPGQPEAETPV